MSDVEDTIARARDYSSDAYADCIQLTVEEVLAQRVLDLEKENDWFYDLLRRVEPQPRIGQALTGQRVVGSRRGE